MKNALIDQIIKLKNRDLLQQFHTDSRKVQAGDGFIALPGKHNHGHHFIDRALASGASLVITDRPSNHPHVYQVDNSFDTMTSLAKSLRASIFGKVIAITGSVGKTTTRHMLNHVLSAESIASSSRENHNNEIGLPISLLSTPVGAEYVILEMGAAKAGDISYLMDIAMPDVGLCLPLHPVHIERYNDFEQLVATKEKIYSQLNDDAFAIIDMDSPYCHRFSQTRANKIYISKTQPSADVYLSRSQYHDHHLQLELNIKGQLVSVSSGLPGEHLTDNILMIAGALIALGIDPIKLSALRTIKPISGRMHVYQHKYVELYDDCYNASYASTKAAIDMVAHKSGPRILIFSDMAELGNISQEEHEKVGEYANSRIDYLVTIGNDSRFAHNAFKDKKQHFDSVDHFLKSLPFFHRGNVVVKGSRFMQLERVTDHIKKQLENFYATEF
tara:strand:+ start:1604 stop:2935 length:1332 start_codon:yes stop_codon:yes gene_type:complete